MGWKVEAGQNGGDLQSASAATTNAILVLFSILPENHKSNWETKWIFGFSLEN
jgi:hypothetical protein